MKKNIILCVDDEQIVLNSLKKQLKVNFGRDFSIETAESGEEAMQVFKELKEEGFKIPILISDYLMPGMKGDELLRKIYKISPKTKSILLTGQASVEAVRYAVNHGNLFRYLLKPWLTEELNSTIVQAHQLYAQQKELLKQNKVLFLLNAELEEKVEERTKELAKKNEELQDLNQEKDDLMSVVAHDLKSPLNQIKGITEVIKLLGNLSEEQEGLFTSIDKILDNGHNLIRDILDINAFEHPDSKIEFADENLSTIILEAVKHFTPQAKKKQIEILYEVKQDIIFRTDIRLVERILRNLISNALKFSENQKKVYIETWQDEEYVAFFVKDQGQGLSHEDKKNLFKKFKKLSAKPTGGESSSGLGLSIIKTLVGKLHGKIEVESQLEVGTTFTIYLKKQ